MPYTPHEAIDRHARSQVRRILDTRLLPYHWEKDAWDTIMQVLEEEEASGMREGGPCAVVTYEMVMEEALNYLRARPDRYKREDLFATVRHNHYKLKSFYGEIVWLQESLGLSEVYTYDEHQMVIGALVGIERRLKELGRTSPDIPS